MVNTKSAFWRAFIFALVIFLLGFLIGFFVENSRTSTVETALLNSEVNLLDEQIRSNTLQEFNVNCNISKESTFNFADRIYGEALKLEEYDSSNKLQGTLEIFHRRYDLLRTQLWTESIKIKENCPNQFHTLVYLYDYNTNNVDKKAEQMAIENLLLDFKDKFPSQTLLIPIAANLNLESVNLILKKYNITEAPAIIVDESAVLKEIPTSKQLENIVFQSNNT